MAIQNAGKNYPEDVCEICGKTCFQRVDGYWKHWDRAANHDHKVVRKSD